MWVVGEKEAGGGNRFPNQIMGFGAAIEPVVRLSAQLEGWEVARLA